MSRIEGFGVTKVYNPKEFNVVVMNLAHDSYTDIMSHYEGL